MNRLKYFTNDEVYILKRQAKESSFEITMCGRYNEHEVETHTKLLNELIREDSIRSDKVETKSSFQSAAEHDGLVRLEDRYLNMVYEKCEFGTRFYHFKDEGHQDNLETLDKYLNGEYDYMHNIMVTISPYCKNDDIKEIFTNAIWYLDDGE